MTAKKESAPDCAPKADKESNYLHDTTDSVAVSKERIIELLEYLLRVAGVGVAYLRPRYRRDGELDTVEIGFIGGHTRTVSVAKDSHIAIILDVLKGV